MAKAGQEARKRSTQRPRRRSRPRARLRFLGLTSDWYWEQDAELRFTRVEVRNDAAAEQALAERIVGKKRWETGVEIEGGWDAHRAMLEARAPFRDVLMWRNLPDGARRYISVSGEPMFDARGPLHRLPRHRPRRHQAEAHPAAPQARPRGDAAPRRGGERAARRCAARCRRPATCCAGTARSCGRPTKPAACCAASRTGPRPATPGAQRFVEALARPRVPARRGPGRHGLAIGRAGLGRRTATTDPRALRTPLARGDRAARRGDLPDPRRRARRRGARVHLAPHAPARQAPVADAGRDRHADRPVPRPRRSRARGARERSALPRAHQPVLRLVLGAGHRVPLHAPRRAATWPAATPSCSGA